MTSPTPGPSLLDKLEAYSMVLAPRVGPLLDSFAAVCNGIKTANSVLYVTPAAPFAYDVASRSVEPPKRRGVSKTRKGNLPHQSSVRNKSRSDDESST